MTHTIVLICLIAEHQPFDYQVDHSLIEILMLAGCRGHIKFTRKVYSAPGQ